MGGALFLSQQSSRLHNSEEEVVGRAIDTQLWDVKGECLKSTEAQQSGFSSQRAVSVE